MDSVTQLLFGGVVAQAGARRILGRRAVAAGALIATLPDLDVLSGLFGPESITDGWLYHRAVSHSIPATLIYGTAIGWMIWKAERLRRKPADTEEDRNRRHCWMWLGALACVTHPVLDLFTAYGTQLLAPFSAVRFAIDAMPIIDPLYTLPLLVAFLFGLTSRAKPRHVQRMARFALVYVVLYTTMAWGIGLHMQERTRAELRAAHVVHADTARVAAYPVLFQPWWRRIVVDLPDAILIGFASPFAAKPIAWQTIPRPDRSKALQAAEATYDAGVFRWFADGRLHWTLKPDPMPDNAGGLIAEAHDYRYGMPGDSILGFWGLRFRLTAQNEVVGPPQYLTERPRFSRASFEQLRDGVLGR
ncbi:metal-dependent hydrolase [Ferrovibrio sp.]|uniref:metal-dependent hydrolase n=1 Tax=Ferrovibrio sp. TaxID=1917215 RepID=UPI00262B0AE9|nr:metal-dependent hydrolase [Ferrovibrio sp.]